MAFNKILSALSLPLSADRLVEGGLVKEYTGFDKLNLTV
jgi:hypothetical protein